MGQYYMTVNIDKKQYLNPHRFGSGLKLLEFSCDSCGLMTGLAILLSNGNGRGGGDLHSDDPIVGSWAGDRIVVAGDYGDEGAFMTLKDRREWRESFTTEEWEGIRRGRSDDDIIPNLYWYAERCMEDISGKVMLAMCADEWLRQDVLKSLLDGFAHDAEENKALVKEIVKKYKCQGQVDTIKGEIAEYWRKQREKWAKEN